MELSGAVIGHSFVRRLRQDLLKRHHNQPTLTMGTGMKTPWVSPQVRLSRALGVAHAFKDIHLESNNIVFIRDLYHAVQSLSDVTLSVVLIDIGSNDLAHVDYFNPVLVLKLATMVIDFAIELNARGVVINAILPRTGRMTSNPDTFRQNADLYNTIINDFCETNPKLTFNKMRGFSQTVLHRSATKSERQQPPRMVASWSNDGIHCDRQDSLKRYQKRTKFALLEAGSKLTDYV